MTSGTAFVWRKLPFKKMLFAIWFVANSVKGNAALQLSRELGVLAIRAALEQAGVTLIEKGDIATGPGVALDAKP